MQNHWTKSCRSHRNVKR